MTKLNNTLTNYDIRQLLSEWKRDIFLSLNCHGIGTIQSFDETNQTAKITLNYKQTFSSTLPGTPDELVPYPILLDCPVIVLRGGKSSLTFPIAEGDECLVFFNDRDIDKWFAGNSSAAPMSSRLHSFSDALALVGVSSDQTKLASYDTDRVVLKNEDVALKLANDEALLENGDAKLTLASDKSTLAFDTTKVELDSKVNIENAATDLKTVINGLIDIIAAVMTIPAVPGSPLTLSPPDILALNNYKTTVGNLLK